MTKEDLINHLINVGVLNAPEIIEAFQAIDRANFVRIKDIKNAYGDYPLLIGNEATISQPTTVAFMLELLQVKAGDMVLDVGSGSGWTTALLAHIAGDKGKVYGVEIIPELVEFGRKNIKKYKFTNAKIMQADKKIGAEYVAPFDKILVSATSDDLPQELLNQLKVGGRIVIPIKSSVWKIDKVSRDKIDKVEFPGFSFVPLRAAR